MTTTAPHFPRHWPALIVGSLAAAALVLPVQAAETQGLQISPPITELRLDPGTSSRGIMKVTNLTGQQMTLNVAKQNFVARGEEGEVELVDNANPLYSLAPWFSVAAGSIELPPKATREIAYNISVPTDAEPGGRYGSLVFDTIPPKLPNGQSGAAVKQRLGGLIFLRVNGNANEQLAIDSFKTGKSFYEYGPVSFEALIKNLGNVHAKPAGQIVVKNLLGLKTATIKLDEKNVIPGATRKLTAELKKNLLLGYYTAELTVQNGVHQTLTSKTSFTVIPYKIVIIILVILIVIFIFFRKARKRLGRAWRILAGKE